MNTFIFDNSTLNSINTFSDTPTKLQNNGSFINTIESLKTTTVLSGTYECNFKFINSTSINIEKDFKLNSGNFSVINDETPLSTFYIIGVLDSSISNFTINCSTNTKIVSAFFGDSTSNININCNIHSIFSDTLILVPYNTNTDNNKLKVNLINESSKKIEIFADIKNLDLSNNSQIELFLSPTIQVDYFNNFTNTTLSSLSTTPEMAKKIEEQNPLTNITLNTIPFITNFENGKSQLKIPKIYNINNITSAYIFIGSNRYPINII